MSESTLAPAAPVRAGGLLAAAWGILGVAALLSNALERLAPMAGEALSGGQFGAAHWVALAACVGFMGFFEGYRAFQRGFCPRVVSRALHLAAHPRPLHVLLAPLYCMGLVHASRRRLTVSWSLTLGIVCLVVAVRMLAQPWRGIVDAGVVVGLGWGLVSLLALALRAAAGRPPEMAIELPAAR